MKKIFAILLAVLMVLSAAACGENTDQPGGDKPSGGNTSQSGEDNPGGDNTGDSGKKTSAGSYHYAPPADGYSLEFTSIRFGETGKGFVTKVGNVFVEGNELDDMKFKYDFNAGEVLADDWAGSYGWTHDEGTSIDDYSYADLSFYDFETFESDFMSYFYGYGKTVDQLDTYNVGTEKIAGCQCWVFDAMGLNAIEGKYWINMDNGICMKYRDADGDGFEITKLDLNFKG